MSRLGIAGAVLLVVFVFVERSATEPVLPLHLFSNRGFSVTSVVGFIVGFAMFGAITYLPLFFQIVHGESPTASGLQLLPLLAGLIICSTGSGIVISKTGRYRIFPIAGTALITIGLVLLAQVGIGTSLIVSALYMFVLGVGLGCVMQVLVLIVQNAVPYSELGVATSGATFFRSIGGSFGTAIFGAIFSNVLSVISSGISGPPGCPEASRAPASPRPSSTSFRRPSITASPLLTPSRSRRCSSSPHRSASSRSSRPGSYPRSSSDEESAPQQTPRYQSPQHTISELPSQPPPTEHTRVEFPPISAAPMAIDDTTRFDSNHATRRSS